MKDEFGDPGDVFMNALSAQVDGIVTGFVVIYTYADREGEHHIGCDTMRDQRCHQTMGMLSFGLAIEERRAQLSWEYDE